MTHIRADALKEGEGRRLRNSLLSLILLLSSSLSRIQVVSLYREMSCPLSRALSLVAEQSLKRSFTEISWRPLCVATLSLSLFRSSDTKQMQAWLVQTMQWQPGRASHHGHGSIIDLPRQARSHTLDGWLPNASPTTGRVQIDIEKLTGGMSHVMPDAAALRRSQRQ
jgi:hypothetical protein